jgi:hypothetical protein
MHWPQEGCLLGMLGLGLLFPQKILCDVSFSDCLSVAQRAIAASSLKLTRTIAAVGRIHRRTVDSENVSFCAEFYP